MGPRKSVKGRARGAFRFERRAFHMTVTRPLHDRFASKSVLSPLALGTSDTLTLARLRLHESQSRT